MMRRKGQRRGRPVLAGGVYLAATSSVGGVWPAGEGRAPRGGTIVLSAEDDLADTIRPRLDAAGANPSRVHVARAVLDAGGPHGFDLGRDLQTLDAALEASPDVRLVIIDPLTAYLGKIDSQSRRSKRQACSSSAQRA
jgi:hypothetical protein